MEGFSYRRMAWRFITVVGLSLLSAGGSWWWYHAHDQGSVRSGEEIAEVLEVQGESLRKPGSKLLWLPVFSGTSLFEGDQLRTEADAELQIRLRDGGVLRLEPESLVVLQTGGKGLKVEWLEGEGEVKDAEGQMQNSRTESATEQEERLVTLVPDREGKFYIERDQKQFQILLAVSSPSFTELELWGGSKRKELQKIQSWSGEDPSSWILRDAPWPNYIQIRARQGEKLMVSKILRLKPIYLDPPRVLSPVHGVEYEYQEQGMLAQLHWPVGISSFELSLKQKNKIIWRQSGDQSEQVKFLLPALGEGSYTLEARVVYPNGVDRTASPVNFFVRREQAQVKPPLLVEWLENSAKLAYPKLPLTHLLRWKTQFREDEIATWSLAIKAIDSQEGEQVFTWSKQEVEHQALGQGIKGWQKGLSLDRWGGFEFQLEAQTQSGESLGRSAWLKLSFEMLPLIGPVEHNYLEPYISDGFGNGKIQWAELAGAKSYVIRLQGQDKILAQVQTVSWSFSDWLPGTYKIEIAPIDEWGRGGLASTPITVQVPEVSAIRAPSSKKIQVK